MSTNLEDPRAGVLAAHLCANAWRYLSMSAGSAAQATLVQVERRTLSCLYRFDVSVGDRREAIIVKVPIPDAGVGRSAQSQALGDLPRVASVPDSETKAALEHAALLAIHEHFTALADPRLGAIRVFDYLPEQRAVVMQYVPEPNLRHVVVKPWRTVRREPARKLDTVFRNVGAWLRRWHEMPTTPHLTERHVTRASFVEYVARLTTFLGRSRREPTSFARIARDVESTAAAVLPPILPLGRAHGDFAMRNVLVSSDARVTVLDTLGRFSTAIYEDLGYLLADLKCNPMHSAAWAVRVGRRRISAFELAFLAGYFEGEEVPTRAVALYEVKALLERWASLTVRRELAAGVRKHVAGMAYPLVTQRFFSLLKERLRVAAGDTEMAGTLRYPRTGRIQATWRIKLLTVIPLLHSYIEALSAGGLDALNAV